MKERPILFSAPMVRAILNGSKTQTRRVVKPQPSDAHNFAGFTISSIHPSDEGKAVWGRGDTRAMLLDAHRVRCPYGKPGDQLWVRETWDFLPDGGPDEPNVAMIRYWAGGDMERRVVPPDFNPNIYSYEKKRPSIHMPRWASRIQLEITNIRVERLQDCSPADAVAEGIELSEQGRCKMYDHKDGEEHLQYAGKRFTKDPIESYRSLWLSINGPGSWDANPWVWVVEFRRIKP